MELRCASKLYGIVVRPGVLEVKCNSRFCGARKGVVVLHWFEMDTGKLLNTKEFKSIDL